MRRREPRLPSLPARRIGRQHLAADPRSSLGRAAASDTYKSVTASGAFGKAPTVTIPAKGTGALYTKTLIQGTGAKLTSSEGLIGNFVAYDWSGKTRKLIGSTYTQGARRYSSGRCSPALRRARRAEARQPGARGDPAQGRVRRDGQLAEGHRRQRHAGLRHRHGLHVPKPRACRQAGNQRRRRACHRDRAGGEQHGRPDDQDPGKTTAPKTLQVKTLIKGTGAVVKKGHDIAVQYTGVIWRTGKVFDSSWSRNTPLTTVIGEGQVITGWDTGLVGQTVGSRVLLVIPPADGYGSAGASQAGINGTDTLVFVVDILAAA